MDRVLLDRVREAATKRKAWFVPGRDCVRLVDDEGDDLPGLVVEAWSEHLRVETTAARWRSPEVLDEVARAVFRTWRDPHSPGRERGVAYAHRGAGGAAEIGSLSGFPVPSGVVVEERGRRFFVRLVEEGAPGTGLFLDHRPARALVEEHVEQAARGGVVLNLFGHAGGFTVAAAAAGAGRVDHVDLAKKTAPWAALNLALNGLDPRRHRFIVDDAFAFLRRAARKGGHSLIVCDPPTTALGKKGKRFVAGQVLAELARDSLLALEPGGRLLLSCNDRRLRQADFHDAVRSAASGAGVQLAAVEPLELDQDFTSRDPEKISTKGVWVQRD